MRELGLVGVIQGLVESSPPCGRALCWRLYSAGLNGIEPSSARLLALIKWVQIVMIHYPLGFDVIAEWVVDHHYLYRLDHLVRNLDWRGYPGLSHGARFAQGGVSRTHRGHFVTQVAEIDRGGLNYCNILYIKTFLISVLRWWNG